MGAATSHVFASSFRTGVGGEAVRAASTSGTKPAPFFQAWTGSWKALFFEPVCEGGFPESLTNFGMLKAAWLPLFDDPCSISEKAAVFNF